MGESPVAVFQALIKGIIDEACHARDLVRNMVPCISNEASKLYDIFGEVMRGSSDMPLLRARSCSGVVSSEQVDVWWFSLASWWILHSSLVYFFLMFCWMWT